MLERARGRALLRQPAASGVDLRERHRAGRASASRDSRGPGPVPGSPSVGQTPAEPAGKRRLRVVRDGGSRRPVPPDGIGRRRLSVRLPRNQETRAAAAGAARARAVGGGTLTLERVQKELVGPGSSRCSSTSLPSQPPSLHIPHFGEAATVHRLEVTAEAGRILGIDLGPLARPAARSGPGRERKRGE